MLSTLRKISSRITATIVASLVAVAGVMGVGVSSAAAASPAWMISAVAEPTNFASTDIVSESFTVAVSATGGTFTVTAGGATTEAIAYNAPAAGSASVQSALDALPSIGGVGGSVTVTGGPGDAGATSPYVITVGGSLAGKTFEATPEGHGESLTGGSQTVEVVEVSKGRFVDMYVLTATNVGGAASAGTITIKDVLPPNVVTSATPQGEGWTCAPAGGGQSVVSCTTSSVVGGSSQAPVILMAVKVLPSASGTLSNQVEVSGGGAAACGGAGQSACPSARTPTTVGASPPTFGFVDFSSYIAAPTGLVDIQAGEHPSSMTVNFTLPGVKSPGLESYAPVEYVKDVAVDLPLGFVGNPQAAPKCSLTELVTQQVCPGPTRVGTFSLLGGGSKPLQQNSIYNVVPEEGYAAEFGTYIPELQKAVLLYASVAPTASGYVVRVTSPGLPNTVDTRGASLTFFGNPVVQDGSPGSPLAFFTNPGECGSSAPLVTRAYADSWEHPGRLNPDGTIDVSDPSWKTASSSSAPVVGCDPLQFNPSISLVPETTQADEPSGYVVDVKNPQGPEVFPNLATPDLRKIEVTLPEGVSVSPSAADGLQACTDAQFQVSSIAPASCPPASQVATVKATTPILTEPLEGRVFVGAPGCAPCTNADAQDGNLFRLFLQVQGPGVVIKLPGTVSADPATGRLTAKFDNLVQQPVSDVKVQFKGGPRAPLANPQECAQATTTSDVAPWSSPVTPDATPSSSFNVNWDGAGGACPASLPFAPSFSAGTVTPTAGAFSPFPLTFSRHDREQDLSGLTVTTPPGLLGMLSQVQLCPEPQASQGTCGLQSQIGHTQVAAGAGSHPFWVGGNVFLTGPYKGAPFGLSIVTPAKAGPFNLGNVIVRAAIRVDPHTSALTVTSDPLPQIVDGVPLRIQTVNVTVDEPGFMFNPTSCEPMQIAGTLTSLGGLNAPVSSRFQTASCANLPFKPDFKVSTSGRTSKANGASLHVHLSTNEGPSSNPQAPAEADIAKVDVQLPVVLPSRLSTLQKACTAAQFNSNPAGCPEGSFVGTAVAHTPILNAPLAGPAVLVSHGGAAFPDLVIVLQGEGVRIDLVGNTDIKRGLTYSRFETVPDAPVTSFDLTLPEGPHSVLAANGNLCAPKATTVKKRVSERVHGRTIHVVRNVKQLVPAPLLMPTTMIAQNGAVIQQTTNIGVSGCPKAKKVKKAKRAGKAAHRGGKRRK
jgi:hypothetical protein